MAALDVATGKVTGQMVARHRSEEFLAFLELVSEGIEPGTQVHVILDNVSSDKSAEVKHSSKRDSEAKRAWLCLPPEPAPVGSFQDVSIHSSDGEAGIPHVFDAVRFRQVERVEHCLPDR